MNLKLGNRGNFIKNIAVAGEYSKTPFKKNPDFLKFGKIDSHSYPRFFFAVFYCSVK